MAVACAASTTAAWRVQYRVLLYIDGLYLHKYTSAKRMQEREVKPAARVLLRARCDVATDAARCKCAFGQYRAMRTWLSSFHFFFHLFLFCFFFLLGRSSPFFFCKKPLSVVRCRQSIIWHIIVARPAHKSICDACRHTDVRLRSRAAASTENFLSATTPRVTCAIACVNLPVRALKGPAYLFLIALDNSTANRSASVEGTRES